MLTSFYSALSGLSAYASALNVVGNNIANINTSGFKGSSINFYDLVTRTFNGVSASGSGNPMQIGLGSYPASVSGIFNQGSIQVSQEGTNVAIEGNGFFIVGNSDTERVYTRNGAFSFNQEGYLVDPSGYRVYGYTQKDPATGANIPSGQLQPIYMAANSISDPAATSFMQVYMNLDNTTDVGDTYSASSVIYDSKGAQHTLDITYTHTGGTPDSWSYEVTIPGEEVVGGTAGTPYSLATGTMTFNDDGTLATPAADVALNIPAFTNGGGAMTVNWDLWSDGGAATVTSYPLASAVSYTNQNGYPPGNLSSIIIDQQGIIQGVFSNGQVEDIAQIALANFNNPKGLLRTGLNHFSETLASGVPAYGSANTGGRGSINGGSLEASNVDMATEFVNMLLFERGYQANSRTIRTSDEIIQEALSIKR